MTSSDLTYEITIQDDRGYTYRYGGYKGCKWVAVLSAFCSMIRDDFKVLFCFPKVSNVSLTDKPHYKGPYDVIYKGLNSGAYYAVVVPKAGSLHNAKIKALKYLKETEGGPFEYTLSVKYAGYRSTLGMSDVYSHSGLYGRYPQSIILDTGKLPKYWGKTRKVSSSLHTRNLK